MNPILYMVSLFYRWFNNQKSSKLIAYESALMVFSAILFFNFIALLKLFHIDSFSFDINQRSKLLNYLFFGAGLLIASLFLSIFAPRGKVKSINYDLRDEVVDYTIMFIYSIGSFILLIFLY